MTMSVSVVIPTYNRAAIVGQAVESALAQTLAPCEVIVVDDGSSDDTEAALQRFGDRVRFVRQRNAGPAAARNRGIRQSNGEFVAFLDSDDLWMTQKLERQMGLFASDPSLGVVSCLSRYVSFDGETLADTGPGQATLRAGDPASIRRLLLGNTVSGGSSAVVRRDCLDALGLFDESLWGVEDWDLWLRAAKRYSIGFVNEPLTIMRSGASNLSSPRNMASMLENELRLLRKHFADRSYRIGAYDRGMAVAERYGRAAWAWYSIGDTRPARRCLFLAIASNPLHMAGQPAFAGLLGRLLVGERRLGILKRLVGRQPAADRSA